TKTNRTQTMKTSNKINRIKTTNSIKSINKTTRTNNIITNKKSITTNRKINTKKKANNIENKTKIAIKIIINPMRIRSTMISSLTVEQNALRFFVLPKNTFIETHKSVEREHHKRTSKKEVMLDRKSTRLNSSHVSISYAVFCLK